MWANVTMQSKKMWTNVANVPKKGTERNLLKKKKREQNHKSIAVCISNALHYITRAVCWEKKKQNKTRKALQRARLIAGLMWQRNWFNVNSTYTQICSKSDIFGGTSFGGWYNFWRVSWVPSGLFSSLQHQKLWKEFEMKKEWLGRTKILK